MNRISIAALATESFFGFYGLLCDFQVLIRKQKLTPIISVMSLQNLCKSVHNAGLLCLPTVLQFNKQLQGEKKTHLIGIQIIIPGIVL